MAKKRQEDPPKGSPAWMATFSDLMNLLLCFFVLLYSMSSVDEAKFQEVVASLQSSMSILTGGATSIGEGMLISTGVRQLEFLDSYYREQTNSKTDVEDQDEEEFEGSVEDLTEAYEKQELEESEEMAEHIQQAIEQSGIQNLVEVDFNGQYVQLSLSGAVLFASGQSDILDGAYPIVDKICTILGEYDSNLIEVEGHTDNVPISKGKYESNDVLSYYRAHTVADYVRTTTELAPSNIKESGRGAYDPIADNTSAEGRARNRRVEIKIFNSFNSDLD